jgi:hypothetical protein
MAEMVLLAPIMILMWIGIDYFRAGWARRLDAIARSHAQAWTLAYSNDGSCFKAKEPWAGFTGENNAYDPNNTGEKGSQAAQTFGGNTSSSLFMYAHASVMADQKTGDARWVGGSGGSVYGGTYVACNEVVPATNAESKIGSNGGGKFDDQDVITPLWDFIRSLF